jgi:hypothetical protein
MCWRCDNPDASEEDYLKLVRREIDSHGWFIQHVEKDRLHPPFSYTVGLTEIGSPELLVTGWKLQKAGEFLNGRARGLMFHEDPTYVAGDVHAWPDLVVEVVDVAEPDVHLVMAWALYGPLLKAVQLVHADDCGHWPWYPGFRGSQPVLGPRVLGRVDQ